MKKHVSRIALLIICACLIIPSFTSCDKKSENGKVESGNDGSLEAKYLKDGGTVPFTDLDGQEIYLAAHYDLTPPERGTTPQNDLYLDRIEYIESKYNCKIKYKTLVESQMVTQIVTSVAAKKPVADMVLVFSTVLLSLADQGKLQNMDESEHINLDEEKWAKSVTKMGTYKGKRYTFEHGIHYPRTLLFWNKTLFEEKGMPNLYDLQAKGEWTFDKFQEIAIALTEDTDGDNVPDIYGVTGYGGFLMREQAILSNGGTLIDINMETGKPTFSLDQPAAVEATQWLMDLHQKYDVIDEPEASTMDYYCYSFKNRTSAMMVMELFAHAAFSDMKDDYGIVLFPAGPSSDGKLVSSGGPFAVNTMLANNPKVKEAAFIYDLLTEPSEKYGDTEDSWKDGYEEFVRDEESLESIRLASDNSVVDRSWAYEEVRSPMIEALRSAWEKDQTLAQALEQISVQAQSMLDEIYASSKGQ